MKINLDNYLDIVVMKDALEGEMERTLKYHSPNNQSYKSLLKSYNQIMNNTVLTSRRFDEHGKIEKEEV